MKRRRGKWILLTLVAVILGVFAWRVLTREDPNPREVVEPRRPGTPTGILDEPPPEPAEPVVPREPIGELPHPGARLHVRLFWQPTPDQPPRGRLVCEITALEGNLFRLPPDTFVPYLEVTYRIEAGEQAVSDQTPAEGEGPLHPYLAPDGLFYATALQQRPAAGNYEALIQIAPPAADRVAPDSAGEQPLWPPAQLAFAWHIEQEDGNPPSQDDNR